MAILTKVVAVLLVSGLAGLVNATPIADNIPPRGLELDARGGDGVHHGWATYYSPSQGRGACGWNNKDSEHVVAISKALWDETFHGGASSKCGETAVVSWHGKSVSVRVVDLCVACGHDDLDLSPSAFEQLADKDVGQLNGVSWRFV
ncbi:barwin-like endoglucanase [Ceratobasidium sp. AG-I]|nr:barwin-like endoglucanase [Ceratobasidium sp. AG-I]